ncbi:hypothetical protein M0R45_021762 [Rubus argutus]|uniref:RRM domain-containing protein n=1 Tax=Rubus argutus TaxID=59490 RepID=A0AAW1XCL0_RUBAR
MGAKAKKAMKKQLSKASASASAQKPVSSPATAAPDFLPLEGGPARKLPEEKPRKRLPRLYSLVGYHTASMKMKCKVSLGSLGVIKRLRFHATKRKKKLPCLLPPERKSKHFGFIEFEDPAVAKIVAETMHNYLLFEHFCKFILFLQSVFTQSFTVVAIFYEIRLVIIKRRGKRRSSHINLIVERLNHRAKPLNWVQIERKRHDKERTMEEHRKLVERIKKRDLKRQKKNEAAGIDYECPENYCSVFLILCRVNSEQPAPKKKKSCA